MRESTGNKGDRREIKVGGVAWPEQALAQPQPWADLPSRKYKRQEGATPTPAFGGRRRSAEPPSRQASKAGNKASPLGPPSAGKRPETPGPACREPESGTPSGTAT